MVEVGQGGLPCLVCIIVNWAIFTASQCQCLARKEYRVEHLPKFSDVFKLLGSWSSLVYKAIQMVMSVSISGAKTILNCLFIYILVCDDYSLV